MSPPSYIYKGDNAVSLHCLLNGRGAAALAGGRAADRGQWMISNQWLSDEEAS